MSDHVLDAVRPKAAARPGLVLAIVVTCQLMLMLDATVLNVALPRIRADLHFSATGLSWVLNAYTLVFGGLLLLGGRAGDLLGRRRVFLAGTTLFTAASFAGGLAGSPAVLIAARIAQGLGAAAAGPSVLALLTTTFTEPRARIRALSIFSGVASAGFAIGLILGGLLTELSSWRAVLFINVPVGAAVVALAARFVGEPPTRPGRLDVPGAVTGSAGVAALVYACIRAAGVGVGDGITLGALACGAALLACFVVIELRSAQPLVPPRLFADRDRVAAYVSYLLGPMGMMSMFFFLTQYLQDVHHLSPLVTGLAFLPMAATLFPLARFIPRLLPRFGPRALAATGALLLVAGLAWLSRLTVDTGYATGLLGPLVLLGLGSGLGLSPLNVVIMSTVRPEDAGSAGGVLQTAQNIGASLGLAVLVTVFGAASRGAAAGGATPRHAMVTGMADAFTVSTFVAVGIFCIALTFRGTRDVDAG